MHGDESSIGDELSGLEGGEREEEQMRVSSKSWNLARDHSIENFLLFQLSFPLSPSRRADKLSRNFSFPALDRNLVRFIRFARPKLRDS